MVKTLSNTRRVGISSIANGILTSKRLWFSLIKRTKPECPFSSLLPYRARCWSQCNKESRCNNLIELKEKVKLPPFAGNMIIYVENPRNRPLKLYSVQFSCSVVSGSLRPHESQHARPPCPSPTPGVHSDSRPLSQWCHPAISTSVVPFSSCPQSLPAHSLFQWVNSSHEVAKLLEFQL